MRKTYVNSTEARRTCRRNRRCRCRICPVPRNSPYRTWTRTTDSRCRSWSCPAHRTRTEELFVFALWSESKQIRILFHYAVRIIYNPLWRTKQTTCIGTTCTLERDEGLCAGIVIEHRGAYDRKSACDRFSERKTNVQQQYTHTQICEKLCTVNSRTVRDELRNL